jgi:hypothetical protein
VTARLDALKAKYWTWIGSASKGRPPILKNSGYCPTCSHDVTFVARDAWLRDHYRCSNCGSLPRERALMVAIDRYFPGWRNLTVHESSPAKRGASKRLAQDCPRYIPSQFFPEIEPGSHVGDVRCENLEALTFPDASMDLHVTQDVLEHVIIRHKCSGKLPVR